MHESIDTKRSEALQYMEVRDYGSAFGILEKLSAHPDPEDACDILFLCGWCLELDPEGDKARAFDFYTRAFAAEGPFPARLNALFRSAWILLQDRRWPEALPLLQRAVCEAEDHDYREALFHHILFWYANGLEQEARFLEAAEHYRQVRAMSDGLAPEACYRELRCHLNVGRYETALELCRCFAETPPQGFPSDRYNQLRVLIRKEEVMLVECLFDSNSEGKETG